MAVKILEKEKIKDKKDVERITREIKILKKVRHPNVIQLYEVSYRTNNYSTIMLMMKCCVLRLIQVYILFALYYYGEFLFLVINLTSHRLSKPKKTCS